MTLHSVSLSRKFRAAGLPLLITIVLLCHVTPRAGGVAPEGTLNLNTTELTLDDLDSGKTVSITSDIADFDPAKLTITSTQKLVTAELVTGTKNVKVTPVDRGLTVSEAQDTVELVYDPSGQNLKAELKVKIRPRVTGGDLVVVIPGETTQTDVVVKDRIRLVQGQSVQLRLRYRKVAGGPYIYSDKLALTADPPNVVTVTPGSPLTLTVNNLSDKEVKIATHITEANEADPDRAALDFAVEAGEAITGLRIKEGSQIAITEGESRTLGITVLGPGGVAYPASKLSEISPSSAKPAAVNISREDDGRITLIALNQEEAKNKPVQISFTITLPTGETKELAEKVEVTVVGKHGHIEFKPPPREFLLPNSSLNTTVVVRDREGVERPDAGVEFKLADEDDSKWVTLAPEGRTLTIYWNDPPDGETAQRPSQIKVKVTAYPKNLQPIQSEFSVRLRVVKGFMPLTVRLDVMNERMARDLYGKQMADDFHVLVVRLFNNLKDDRTGQFTGDSILAYSSSIEVAVGMEKKFRENKGSHFPNVIKGPESATQDATTQARIKSTRDEAISKDQARLNNLLSEREEAESAVQKARVNMLAAHRKAVASQSHFKMTKAVADMNAANQDIAAYNAAVMALNGAKDNLQLVDMQLKGLRKSILDNASSVYDVSDAYRQYGEPGTVVDDGKWRPLTRSDLEHIASQDAPDNTSFFDDESPQLMAELTDNDANILAPSPAPNSPERPANDGLPPKPQCLGTATYRPFTFEMMANTVDRRDGRSFRTKLFTLLDSLGTAASLVTAVAVPGPSSDFPLGLDKYRNLLIPNAQRLFPDFKEPQRQNIVSQAMKIIEEIPFGSDITRVIFIPRKQMDGVLRGHDVRISEVCTFFFKVDVAIIQKAGTVQAGGAPR